MAAEVRVPGVAVHEVGAPGTGGHGEVDRERLQAPAYGRRRRARSHGAVGDDRRPVARRPVRAPAVHRHLRRAARARARGTRRGRPAPPYTSGGYSRVSSATLTRSTVSPLPITTTPPVGEREALAIGLGVDADLRARRDRDVLVDDRVPHDRAAADVDAVHQHRPLHLGVASARARRGERIERRTVPPETITPAHTIEFMAAPTRARLLLEHELRGRQRLGPGEDRPLLVVEVEDRVDRDQVHVRVVVGVERPDVAPVAAVALARRRAPRCSRSRRRTPRRARRASG